MLTKSLEQSNAQALMTKTGLLIEEQIVDAGLATEFLRSSAGNRKISQRRVAAYSEKMAADAFPITGEPLIFDEHGRLRQGHHRLLAIVACDARLPLLIVRGVPVKAVAHLDSGASWSLADHLSARGEKNATALAATIKWNWRYEHGDLYSQVLTAPSDEMLDWYEARPGLRDSLAAIDGVRRQVRIGASHLGGFHFVCVAIDPADADDFFSKLASGARLSAGSPILALRRWTDARHRSIDRPRPGIVSALLIKTWNYYRDGREVDSLRFRAGGASPEPFPKAH
jgi:hypothetical protein